MLQEAGMWRYAATLTAQALSAPERAASLERWAAHKQQASLSFGSTNMGEELSGRSLSITGLTA